MVSVDQELGSSLAWKFWLTVSHEVALSNPVGLQSSKGLTKAGGSTFKVSHIVAGNLVQAVGLGP